MDAVSSPSALDSGKNDLNGSATFVLKKAFTCFKKLYLEVQRTQELVNRANELRDEMGTGGSEVRDAEKAAEASSQRSRSLHVVAVETVTTAVNSISDDLLASPGELELANKLFVATNEIVCDVDFSDMRFAIKLFEQPSIVGFPRGEKVSLVGLQARPDLNGKEGVVLGYMRKEGRYQILVERQKVLLRDANLQHSNGTC